MFINPIKMDTMERRYQELTSEEIIAEVEASHGDDGDVDGGGHGGVDIGGRGGHV